MYGVFALPDTQRGCRKDGRTGVPSGQVVGLRNTVPPERGQLCVEEIREGVPVLRYNPDGEPEMVEGTFLGEVLEGEVLEYRRAVVRCVRPNSRP